MRKLLLTCLVVIVAGCASIKLNTVVDTLIVGGAAAAGGAVAGPAGAAGGAVLGDMFTEDGESQRKIEDLEEKVNELQTGVTPISEQMTPQFYIKLAGQWVLFLVVMYILYRIWKAKR